jgi:penicillin amidase
LPVDVLRVFSLAIGGVRFAKESINAANPTVIPASPGEVGEAPGYSNGSNNWTIAPSKSATGRAMLANDPHRAYSTPSLRYIAHVSAPGMSIIGAGPCIPSEANQESRHPGRGKNR